MRNQRWSLSDLMGLSIAGWMAADEVDFESVEDSDPATPPTEYHISFYAKGCPLQVSSEGKRQLGNLYPVITYAVERQTPYVWARITGYANYAGIAVASLRSGAFVPFPVAGVANCIAGGGILIGIGP